MQYAQENLRTSFNTETALKFKLNWQDYIVVSWWAMQMLCAIVMLLYDVTRMVTHKQKWTF